MINIEDVIAQAISRKASDIHLTLGVKPIYRINRELVEMNNSGVITDGDLFEVYNYFVKGNEGLEETFEKNKRLDLNFEFNGARLRVNISLSNGLPIFTARTIKNELPKFKELNLPDVVRRTALLPQGLILVTGKSNSGKSTTLNALVNEINQSENKKILMLENPIEYVHYSNI